MIFFNPFVYNYQTWHHVTVTFENGVAKYYMNGVLKKTIQLRSNSIPINNLPLVLGYTTQDGYNSYYYNGLLDDIAIYNRALTAAEISAMYGQPSIEVPVDTTILAGTSYQVGTRTYTEAGTYRDTLRTFEGCDSIVITNLRLRANPCAPVSRNGLVLWIGEGSVNDKSGNNNHGVNNGATLTTDRFGRAGKAHSFDGISNFIQIPNSTSLTIDNKITLCAWVKVAPSYNGTIFNKGESAYLGGQWDYGLSTYYSYPSYRSTANDFIANSTLNRNDQYDNWHFLTATVDEANNITKFYIDGVLLQGTLTTSQGQIVAGSSLITPTNYPLRIGKGHPVNGDNFKGSIGEIFIYNRILTGAEIVNLYGRAPAIERTIDTTIVAGTSYTINNHVYTEGGVYRDTFATQGGCDSIVITNLRLRANPCANISSQGLLVHYTFETNANDVSGNNNHATVVNGAQYTQGKFGNAVKLMGQGYTGTNGQHILLPQLINNNTREFTISQWVKEESLTSADGEAYIWFGNHQTGWLGILHSTSYIYFAVNNVESIRVPFNFQGRFVHYAMTYKDGKLTAYIDGEKVGTITQPINISGTTAGMGTHWWYSVSSRFNGSFDDTRIYNRALTGAEIVNLYGRAPAIERTIDTTIVAGTSYTINNRVYTEPGTYRDTFPTQGGCDSIVITNLRLRANPCANISSQGLLAHYTHDTNANDTSGNNNHATVVNGAQYTQGKFGNAVKLMGQGYTGTNGQHILLPQLINNNTREFTISQWVKEESLTSADGESYIIFGNHQTGWLGIHHGTSYIYFAVNNVESIRVPFNFQGRFVHYAMTYKDGKLTAYIDGEKVGTITQPINISGTTAGMGITWWYSVSSRFNGSFDDTRIYNRALTGAEIVNLYGRQAMAEVRKDTTICTGQFVRVGNNTYNQTGIYRDTISNGCDTVLVTNLTVTPPQYVRIDTAICANKSLIINNKTYRIAGTYQDTLRENSCITKVYTLNLRINALNTNNRNIAICEGDSLVLNSKIYKNAGSYRDTLRGNNVCDTALVLTISIKTKSYSTQFLALCEGDSLRLFNRWIYNAGTFYDTLRNFQGCDSIVTTIINLKRRSNTTLRYTTCEGIPVTVAGQSFATSGTHIIHIPNAAGCDSVITLVLQVNPNKRDTIRRTICQGNTYLFGNESLSTAGTYTKRFRTTANCDSTVVLMLNVIPPIQRQLDTAICAGSVLRIGSYEHRVAGIFNDTLRGLNGCDSLIIRLTLRIKALPPLTVVNRTICQGDSVVINNRVYRQTGNFDIVFRGNGSDLCDSTVQLRLNVLGKSYSTQFLALCEGDSLRLFNRWVYNAGTFYDTIRNYQGCDSIVTTTVNLKRRSNTVLRVTTCEGIPVTVAGQSFVTSGTHIIHIPNATGCDSVITLVLQVNPNKRDTIRRTICQGNTYLFGNESFSIAGTYTKRFRTTTNCDSTVVLILNIIPPIQRQLDTAICAGSVLRIGSYEHRIAGTFNDTLRGFNGCDSLIIHLTLRIKALPPLTVVNRTICQGDSVVMNNRAYRQTGNFDIVFRGNGSDICDSTVQLRLNVLSPTYTTRTFSLCEGDSFRLFNRWVYNAGTFYDTLRNFQGCDSIVTTIVTIKRKTYATINQTICEGTSTVVGGQTFGQAGNFVIRITNTEGCDSVINLILRVNPNKRDTIRQTICQGNTHLFGNEILRTAGTYIRRLRTIDNCDSTVVLILNVIPPIERQLDTAICAGSVLRIGSYEHRIAGTFNDTLRGFNGCDSLIIHLTLRIKALPPLTVVNRTICQGDSVVMNNRAYRQTGNFDIVFRGNGSDICDSTVQLRLNVLSPTYATRTFSLCEGDSFRLFNRWVYNGGTFYDTLRNFQGCDSIVTTIVTIKRKTYATINQTICEGTSTVVGGQTFGQAGNFVIRITNTEGCDSVINLILRVNPNKRDTIRQTICQGNTHLFGNEILRTAGTYTRRLRTIDNCDSTVVLILNVIPPIERQLDTAICAGSVLRIGSYEHRIAGTFNDTLRGFNGCDSLIIRLTLRIKALPPLTVVNRTICQGDSVVMNNRVYREQGVYRFTIPNMEGCDSTTELRLTVYPTRSIRKDTTICEGKVFRFNNRVHTRSGIITDTLHTMFGCDSIVEHNLTIEPAAIANLDTALCQGISLVFGQNTYTNAGTLIDTARTTEGCYRLTRIRVNINPTFYRNDTVNLCNGGVWRVGDSVYNRTGVYTNVFRTRAGCDSTLRTHLTVANPILYRTRDTICEGDTFRIGSLAYTQTGTYRDTLVSRSGCRDSIREVSLVVKNKPIADFMAVPNATNTIAFENMSTNAERSYWRFLPTSSFVRNDSAIVHFTFPNIGEYNITLIAASNRCANDTFSSVIRLPFCVGFVGNIAKVDATCGRQNGSMSVRPIGGTGQYSYLWSTGDTTNRIQNLAVGTYRLTVTSGLCQFVDSAQIILASTLPTLRLIPHNVSCFGGNNGWIEVLTNATNPTFVWSSGARTQNIYSLQRGLYSVTLTDNNCSTFSSINIGSPDSLQVDAIPITGGSCYQANMRGGVPPYRISWSNGDTTMVTCNSLNSSPYISITDANGCHRINYFKGTTKVEDSSLGILKFEVMPNPSDGNVTINIQFSEATNFSIEIYNTIGQNVYNVKHINEVQLRQPLDLMNVANGEYIVMLKTAKGVTYKKLLIAK